MASRPSTSISRSPLDDEEELVLGVVLVPVELAFDHASRTTESFTVVSV